MIDGLTESYSSPLLVMKSAMTEASANVGMSLPIWLKVRTMLLGRARVSCCFDLSPRATMEESANSGFSLKRRRACLVTEEWIPAQRPRSEDTTMISFFPPTGASAVLKTSTVGL